MATGVNRGGPRGGQARTRLARTAVTQAARVLFLERGYAGTTVEAISEASGVPPATVYRLFSSKLGILSELLDRSVAGDEQDVALADRAHVRAIFTDPDPRSQLARFAGLACGVMSRAEPLHRILAGAAGSDPDAAALLAEEARRRDRGQAQIARSLSRAGALRPGLRERDAADIIHALMSPEVYRLLVGDRGWPPQRYQRWLADALIGQLLPGGAGSPAGPGRPAVPG
jgi:TetR/AcrR family transcriptional regulator, regulator of autoinduction and epiphytic fitness